MIYAFEFNYDNTVERNPNGSIEELAQCCANRGITGTFGVLDAAFNMTKARFDITKDGKIFHYTRG